MNEIEIKDIQGKVKFRTLVNEGSVHRKKLMSEDYVQLKFNVSSPIDLKRGDYVDMSFGKYELIDSVYPSYNTSTGGYEYDLRLDAHYWKWKNKNLFYNRGGANREASWTLTRTPDAHLSIICNNLKALGYRYGTNEYDFSIHESVDMSAKLVSYNKTNILDALTLIAETWDTEWWVEDSIIHLGKCEYESDITFEQGGNVQSMSRSESNDNFATRIYAFGSTRNLPRNYREDEGVVVEGVIQKRLMLPSGVSCIDAYENMAQQEAVESIVIFDDVYPRKVNTISDVSTKEYIDTIENEDGSTTKEKWNAYLFKDTGLEFSTDYIIPGEELRIVFTSGALNGMDFGVGFNPNNEPTGSPESQQWEIVRSEDYGTPLPNDSLKPKVGDTYILYGFDTSLVSDQMLPEAEEELKHRAEEYVKKSKQDPSVYECSMNTVDLTSDEIDLNIGHKVNLIHPAYMKEGRVSRIYGFEKHLDGSQVSYTVGDSAPYSRLANVEDQVKEISYQGNVYSGSGGGVYVVGRYDPIKPSDRNVLSSLRSFSEFLNKKKPDVAAEVITFLKGACFGDYSSGTLGSGAAMLVNSETGKTTLEVDELFVRMKAIFKELVIEQTSHIGGELILSPARMKCTEVEEHEEYYRCYFENTDGEVEIQNNFVVGDQARCQTFNIKPGVYENVSNRFYWRLVVGTGDNYIDLSKEDCEPASDTPQAGDDIVQLGNRDNPERQNAHVLSSVGVDAPYYRLYRGIETYALTTPPIDINPNHIHITADSIRLESTGKDLQSSLNDLADDVESIKQQNDKMWVLWFTEEEPTLENYPATEWDTDSLRSEHLQDMVVIDNPLDNSNNGRAWRFHQSEEDGTFYWTEITDKYLLDALSIAVEGRDSANQKRRNFVAQPTDGDVYEVGDTWSNATFTTDDGRLLYDNDSLVAVSNKAKGVPFSINHWQPVNAATSAYLKILSDQITAAAEKIIYDSEGNIVNINTSGLVAKSDFASLFSQAVDEDGNIVKQADISTFIRTDEDGNLTSEVVIEADKINFKGHTIMNNNFQVDEDGTLTAIEANITGEINTNKGNIGGFVIANGRIGSETTSHTDSGGELAIYDNFFRVGGQDGYVMFGNDVIPATAGGAFTATGRIVNNRQNSGDYIYHRANYGLFIRVSGGRKNYGIDSDAALKAPAFINTKAALLTFGSGNYTVDFSQHNIILMYYNQPEFSGTDVTLPSEADVARQFGLESLPIDFATVVTFRVRPNSKTITLLGIYDHNENLINYKMGRGDSVIVLISKVDGFRYQILNHMA